MPSANRIEVVDDVTVRLNLDRPVAWGLIGNALLSSSSIVHAKEILKHETPDDPHGLKWLETKTVESGAFIIETWQKGSTMSLVPNPHALQPAMLERIILHVVPDASTRRIFLERGDVDFAVQLATKDIPDLRKVWRQGDFVPQRPGLVVGDDLEQGPLQQHPFSARHGVGDAQRQTAASRHARVG